MVKSSMARDAYVDRVVAWIRLHRLRLLGIPGVAYGVWVLISSDGQIVTWRGAIVACIVLLLLTDSAFKYVHRRRRERAKKER